jgi:hypothetical protein
VKYTVLMMGLPAGQQALWPEGGKLRAFFQFNDRGRGPKTYSTLALRDGVARRRADRGLRLHEAGRARDVLAAVGKDGVVYRPAELYRELGVRATGP